ncbi:ankyrin repeat domain-containing protein SOWAHA isoform X2 [Melanotaenia boesemani]|uniref:ankyrin repeat domain-containing protein SOWAHA isoform X2 n=1 Tax=Melanotaenia boesemani TaxID=1250792 RepID=UPI001C04F0E9|nr:ankyrin repeat domain-containing protein SOWAHA isoform X2 [Melanotaenia boesemani]
MSDVSEEALLDYFCSAGGESGRVRNADILKTFKPFIGHSDLQLRAKYREEFKLIIDRIALVKSEDGEKYLFLKKKYRHLLHERDDKRQRTDGDQVKHLNPTGSTAAVQWEAADTQTSSNHKEQHDELMSCGDPDVEDQQTGTVCMQHNPQSPPVIKTQESSAQSNRDYKLDRDSGSKSESEHDEECTGSMGSAAVALDPLEKEWIYSAACARVPDLSQLLRQDPSLANKKDFTSFTALHWAAKHGNEDMASLVVNAGADVNTKSHGGYTPLHIAALHGHQHMLDLLVGTYGAKENVRDYSGHLACHYLNMKDPEGPGEDYELQFQVTQARERNKNRKLVSLFHSKKKWGSAEDLAPIEEERTASHQLVIPAFRPRKFSR